MTPEPAPESEDDLLEAKEAAAYLDLSRAKLRRLRESGEIPAVSGGWGRWLFRRGDLIAYMRRVLCAEDLTAHREAAFSATENAPSPAPPSATQIAAQIPPPVDPDAAAHIMGGGPIVRIINRIIVEAIDAGASDIHLEPEARQVRVRFRIDGILREVLTLLKDLQGPVFQRCLVMADLNVTAIQTPETGLIRTRHNNGDYNLRVTRLRGLFGDTIVIRIAEGRPRGFKALGMEPEIQAHVEEAITQPSGLVLLAGPGGAGTTTTLRSVLHKINSLEKKIVAIQQPVEITLGGIALIDLRPERGLTVSEAVRSALLQDADIIALGDLHDAEWVSCAVEAVTAGRLVIATIRAADVVSALLRLVELGLEPQRIPRTVTGVLAQRLARMVCPHCKEEYTADISELRPLDSRQAEAMAASGAGSITLSRGSGCETCRERGYRGRIGLFEMLPHVEEVAELIERRASMADLRSAAVSWGMQPLATDALRKVLDGVTTPQEAMRACASAFR